MENKKMKKLLALMLAGTMTMGMGVTAFAADATSGDAEGSGELEGHVERDVLSVTLPTNVDAGTFKYIIDPEGLIAETDNAKYADATFEEGASVFFQSADKTYTKDSKKLKVTNKGTVNADVTVTAQAATSGDVAMAATSGDVSGDAKKLYLGLDVAGKAEKAVKDDASATVTVGVVGNPDNFETTYNSTSGKYEYDVKANVPETAWNSFEFGLVNGVCSTGAKWTDEDATKVPTVKVTWSYEERDEDTSTADLLDENASADVEPSIGATGTYNKSTGVITANVNLGAGTKVTTIKTAKYGSSVAKATNDVVNPAVNGSVFTGSVSDAVKSGWASLAGPVYVVITLNDGTTQNVTLTMQ